ISAASLFALLSAATPAAGQHQPETTPATTVAPSTPALPHVDIDSDRPGTALFQSAGSTVVFVRDARVWIAGRASSYVPVCVAPCTASLPSDGYYRVGGSGAVASD